MIRMRTESTSGGTTMSDLAIMRQVIGGKQRGHIPGIGPVLPGCGRQTTSAPHELVIKPPRLRSTRLFRNKPKRLI